MKIVQISYAKNYQQNNIKNIPQADNPYHNQQQSQVNFTGLFGGIRGFFSERVSKTPPTPKVIKGLEDTIQNTMKALLDTENGIIGRYSDAIHSNLKIYDLLGSSAQHQSFGAVAIRSADLRGDTRVDIMLSRNDEEHARGLLTWFIPKYEVYDRSVTLNENARVTVLEGATRDVALHMSQNITDDFEYYVKESTRGKNLRTPFQRYLRNVEEENPVSLVMKDNSRVTLAQNLHLIDMSYKSRAKLVSAWTARLKDNAIIDGLLTTKATLSGNARIHNLVFPANTEEDLYAELRGAVRVDNIGNYDINRKAVIRCSPDGDGNYPTIGKIGANVEVKTGNKQILHPF